MFYLAQQLIAKITQPLTFRDFLFLLTPLSHFPHFRESWLCHKWRLKVNNFYETLDSILVTFAKKKLMQEKFTLKIHFLIFCNALKLNEVIFLFTVCLEVYSFHLNLDDFVLILMNLWKEGRDDWNSWKSVDNDDWKCWQIRNSSQFTNVQNVLIKSS